MGMVVVFVTTYMLILPAITLTDPKCGFEEHVHSDECYSKTLVCSEEENATIPPTFTCKENLHSHDSGCYDENGSLVCGKADFYIHKHDDSCYFNDKLVCPLDEIEEHTHTDDCFTEEQVLICGQEETEGHIHDDSCYSTYDELVCGMEESEDHHHDGSCYLTHNDLICGQEEHEGHTHTDDCYKTVKKLTCDEAQLHTHDDSCYEDGVLVCPLPEVTEHVHSADCVTANGHIHTDECYKGELTCGKPEHQHTDDCYNKETSSQDSGTPSDETNDLLPDMTATGGTIVIPSDEIDADELLSQLQLASDGPALIDADDGFDASDVEVYASLDDMKKKYSGESVDQYQPEPGYALTVELVPYSSDKETLVQDALKYTGKEDWRVKGDDAIVFAKIYYKNEAGEIQHLPAGAAVVVTCPVKGTSGERYLRVLTMGNDDIDPKELNSNIETAFVENGDFTISQWDEAIQKFYFTVQEKADDGSVAGDITLNSDTFCFVNTSIFGGYINTLTYLTVSDGGDAIVDGTNDLMVGSEMWDNSAPASEQAVGVDGASLLTYDAAETNARGNDNSSYNRVVRSFDSILYRLQMSFANRGFYEIQYPDESKGEKGIYVVVQATLNQDVTQAVFDMNNMVWAKGNTDGVSNWNIKYYDKDGNVLMREEEDTSGNIVKYKGETGTDPDSFNNYVNNSKGEAGDTAFSVSRADKDDKGKTEAYKSTIVKQVFTARLPITKSGTSNVAIPGQNSFSIGVLATAAKEGTPIEPSFKAWFEGNELNLDSEADGDTLKEPAPDNEGNTLDTAKAGPGSYQRGTVWVTAAPRYNMRIARNSSMAYASDFDFQKGDEVSSPNANSLHGRMFGYGVTFSLYNDTDAVDSKGAKLTGDAKKNALKKKGIRGIELPIGNINFDLTLKTSEESISKTNNYDNAVDTPVFELDEIAGSEASNGAVSAPIAQPASQAVQPETTLEEVATTIASKADTEITAVVPLAMAMTVAMSDDDYGIMPIANHDFATLDTSGGLTWEWDFTTNLPTEKNEPIPENDTIQKILSLSSGVSLKNNGDGLSLSKDSKIAVPLPDGASGGKVTIIVGNPNDRSLIIGNHSYNTKIDVTDGTIVLDALHQEDIAEETIGKCFYVTAEGGESKITSITVEGNTDEPQTEDGGDVDPDANKTGTHTAGDGNTDGGSWSFTENMPSTAKTLSDGDKIGEVITFNGNGGSTLTQDGVSLAQNDSLTVPVEDKSGTITVEFDGGTMTADGDELTSNEALTFTGSASGAALTSSIQFISAYVDLPYTTIATVEDKQIVLKSTSADPAIVKSISLTYADEPEPEPEEAKIVGLDFLVEGKDSNAGLSISSVPSGVKLNTQIGQSGSGIFNIVNTGNTFDAGTKDVTPASVSIDGLGTVKVSKSTDGFGGTISFTVPTSYGAKSADLYAYLASSSADNGRTVTITNNTDFPEDTTKIYNQVDSTTVKVRPDSYLVRFKGLKPGSNYTLSFNNNVRVAFVGVVSSTAALDTSDWKEVVGDRPFDIGSFKNGYVLFHNGSVTNGYEGASNVTFANVTSGAGNYINVDGKNIFTVPLGNSSNSNMTYNILPLGTDKTASNNRSADYKNAATYPIIRVPDSTAKNASLYLVVANNSTIALDLRLTTTNSDGSTDTLTKTIPAVASVNTTANANNYITFTGLKPGNEYTLEFDTGKITWYIYALGLFTYDDPKAVQDSWEHTAPPFVATDFSKAYIFFHGDEKDVTKPDLGSKVEYSYFDTNDKTIFKPNDNITNGTGNGESKRLSFEYASFLPGESFTSGRSDGTNTSASPPTYGYSSKEGGSRHMYITVPDEGTNGVMLYMVLAGNGTNYNLTRTESDGSTYTYSGTINQSNSETAANPNHYHTIKGLKPGASYELQFPNSGDSYIYSLALVYYDEKEAGQHIDVESSADGWTVKAVEHGTITDVNTPLLWDYSDNYVGNSLGEYARRMDWDYGGGRTAVARMAAPYNYGCTDDSAYVVDNDDSKIAYGTNESEAYYGGRWYVNNPKLVDVSGTDYTNKQTYNVTVSGYDFNFDYLFDEANGNHTMLFPTNLARNTAGSTTHSDNGYGSFIGAYSAGYFQVLVPYGDDYNSKLHLLASIGNLAETSLSNDTINTEGQKGENFSNDSKTDYTQDDDVNDDIKEFIPGSFSAYNSFMSKGSTGIGNKSVLTDIKEVGYDGGNIVVKDGAAYDKYGRPAGQFLGTNWGQEHQDYDAAAAIGEDIDIWSGFQLQTGGDVTLSAVDVLMKFDGAAFDLDLEEIQKSDSVKDFISTTFEKDADLNIMQYTKDKAATDTSLPIDGDYTVNLFFGVSSNTSYKTNGFNSTNSTSFTAMKNAREENFTFYSYKDIKEGTATPDGQVTAMLMEIRDAYIPMGIYLSMRCPVTVRSEILGATGTDKTTAGKVFAEVTDIRGWSYVDGGLDYSGTAFSGLCPSDESLEGAEHKHQPMHGVSWGNDSTHTPDNYRNTTTSVTTTDYRVTDLGGANFLSSNITGNGSSGWARNDGGEFYFYNFSSSGTTNSGNSYFKTEYNDFGTEGEGTVKTEHYRNDSSGNKYSGTPYTRGMSLLVNGYRSQITLKTDLNEHDTAGANKDTKIYNKQNSEERWPTYTLTDMKTNSAAGTSSGTTELKITVDIDGGGIVLVDKAGATGAPIEGEATSSSFVRVITGKDVDGNDLYEYLKWPEAEATEHKGEEQRIEYTDSEGNSHSVTVQIEFDPSDRQKLILHLTEVDIGAELPDIQFSGYVTSSAYNNEVINMSAKVIGAGDIRVYGDKAGNQSADTTVIQALTSAAFAKVVHREDRSKILDYDLYREALDDGVTNPDLVSYDFNDDASSGSIANVEDKLVYTINYDNSTGNRKNHVFLYDVLPTDPAGNPLKVLGVRVIWRDLLGNEVSKVFPDTEDPDPRTSPDYKVFYTTEKDRATINSEWSGFASNKIPEGGFSSDSSTEINVPYEDNLDTKKLFTYGRTEENFKPGEDSPKTHRKGICNVGEHSDDGSVDDPTHILDPYEKADPTTWPTALYFKIGTAESKVPAVDAECNLYVQIVCEAKGYVNGSGKGEGFIYNNNAVIATPDAANANAYLPQTVAASTSVATRNISGKVFYDNDQNGYYESKEPGSTAGGSDEPYAGVVVSLFRKTTDGYEKVNADIDGNTFGTGGDITTDSDGYYVFNNLPPGDYYIAFKDGSGSPMPNDNPEGRYQKKGSHGADNTSFDNDGVSIASVSGDAFIEWLKAQSDGDAYKYVIYDKGSYDPESNKMSGNMATTLYDREEVVNSFGMTQNDDYNFLGISEAAYSLPETGGSGMGSLKLLGGLCLAVVFVGLGLKKRNYLK